MSKEVKLEENNENGVFHIDIDGKTQAKMTFFYKSNDEIIIDHTEVNEGNQGSGFGKKLVDKAVDFAREKNLKIIPQCSFAKGILEKNSKYQDILK